MIDIRKPVSSRKASQNLRTAGVNSGQRLTGTAQNVKSTQSLRFGLKSTVESERWAVNPPIAVRIRSWSWSSRSWVSNHQLCGSRVGKKLAPLSQRMSRYRLLAREKREG